MTSMPAAPATPVTIADVFIHHLATGAFEELGALCEPDVVFSALLPGGLRETEGPESVSAAFAHWFGRAEQFAILEASVDELGPRLQLQWRARVDGGSFDAPHLVEQQVYLDPAPSGRVAKIALLCSGFVREPSDG